MPGKCCVFACRINCDSTRSTAANGAEKIFVHRFPQETDERVKWINAVTNTNLTVNNNTVICELHWPKNFEIIKAHGGKLRPKHPPFMWLGIPTSQILTPTTDQRTT